jgi:hypothetical protein
MINLNIKNKMQQTKQANKQTEKSGTSGSQL